MAIGHSTSGRLRIEGRSLTAELSQGGVAMTHVKRFSKRTTITFGSVMIKGATLPVEEIRRNIASGNSALERALEAFTKPGVRLSRARNIPF